MEKRDTAVMDFLAATNVQKYPPKIDRRARAGGQRAEKSELAGSPWFHPI